ncbi:MAG: PH domain-containing protein [Bacteroidota bacterium]
MKTFRSKVDTWLLATLIILLGGTASLMAYERIWFMMVSIMLIAGFISYMLFNTIYRISGKTLIIRSGFLSRQTIEIGSITRISESNDIITSPAASLDRLEIIYGKRKRILVSPRDKTGFIKELSLVNPGIEVRMKKK